MQPVATHESIAQREVRLNAAAAAAALREDRLDRLVPSRRKRARRAVGSALIAAGLKLRPELRPR